MRIIDIVEDPTVYEGELKMTLPRITDIVMVDGDKAFDTIQKMVDCYPDKISLYDGIPVLRETDKFILNKYVTEETFPYDSMVGRLVRVSDDHAVVIFTQEYAPIIRKSIEMGNFERLRISFVMTADDYRNPSPNVLACLIDTHTQYEIMVKESDYQMIEEPRPALNAEDQSDNKEEDSCADKIKKACIDQDVVECSNDDSEEKTYDVYCISVDCFVCCTVPVPKSIKPLVATPTARVEAISPADAISKGIDSFIALELIRSDLNSPIKAFYYNPDTDGLEVIKFNLITDKKDVVPMSQPLMAFNRCNRMDRRYDIKASEKKADEEEKEYWVYYCLNDHSILCSICRMPIIIGNFVRIKANCPENAVRKAVDNFVSVNLFTYEAFANGRIPVFYNDSHFNFISITANMIKDKQEEKK